MSFFDIEAIKLEQARWANMTPEERAREKREREHRLTQEMPKELDAMVRGLSPECVPKEALSLQIEPTKPKGAEDAYE